jgi:glutamyl/glutaminyl-tRNA synthetase
VQKNYFSIFYKYIFIRMGKTYLCSRNSIESRSNGDKKNKKKGITEQSVCANLNYEIFQ